MPQQMIDTIREAENRASEIRSKALEEAKAAVRSAEEEIAAWKEEQLKLIRQEAREMIETATQNAASKAAEADARYDAQRKVFREKAAKNMDHAVKIVVERIVKR